MTGDAPSSAASLSEREGNVWDSDTYGQNARFVTSYGDAVLDLLAPVAGERVLDLGCGDGVHLKQLTDAGVIAVGIDTSESFVATAREAKHDARLMSGETMTFDAEFDAVFSNAAIHWMKDKTAVCRSAARALRPGGRFVGEFGGHGNVAAIVTALHAVSDAMDGDPVLAQPGTYPTVQEFRADLEAAGFAVSHIETFYRPTPLPTGIRGWLQTMRVPYFAQFGMREAEAYDRVEAALSHTLCDGDGQWMADYVRLRFVAHLPS